MHSSPSALRVESAPAAYAFAEPFETPRVMAILFSDVERFTVMTERLGDRQAMRVMHHHNRVVRESLAETCGEEIELRGDTSVVAHQSVESALDCAIFMQRRFATEFVECDLRVRIGVHIGSVLPDGDHYFGMTMILASRIMSLARGGEILTSESVWDASSGRYASHLKFASSVALKGVRGMHSVYRLGWRS